ncbi:MAG: hypothetical protein LBM73_03735 [Candidatus Nomurabacteria bacterium]|jgi:hypothetical protein|nr:hypothetical protein [Candidatus Nomurabacteria bacterium]
MNPQTVFNPQPKPPLTAQPNQPDSLPRPLHLWYNSRRGVSRNGSTFSDITASPAVPVKVEWRPGGQIVATFEGEQDSKGGAISNAGQVLFDRNVGDVDRFEVGQLMWHGVGQERRTNPIMAFAYGD